MFNVAFAFVLSRNDTGQTVFLTQPVRGAADFVIALFVGMVVLVIRKADRIEYETTLLT